MMKIAAMQGRLGSSEDGRIQCSPRMHWHEEFAKAEDIRLYGIEWIDDLYSADENPLFTDAGLTKLRSLITTHGVCIPAVCVNRCIEEPIFRCTDVEREARIDHLRTVLQQAKKIGADHIVLPFLDSASLATRQDEDIVIAALKELLPDADALDIEIHLETSLAPRAFAAFLERISDPLIRVTYDIGNSAGFNFDPHEEFAAYGDRVGSVHIKDKPHGGSTVPLGTGDADFATIAQELKNVDFRGLYTLEAARQANGDEVRVYAEYRAFAERWFAAV
ncbi:sugar phosphate isomerase/epimerase [Candidatus Peregrinibacteria bacterium]|nr:sugar phosphate isomerase/epimerase [Candidatus Peregrinibacteria bacterium]